MWIQTKVCSRVEEVWARHTEYTQNVGIQEGQTYRLAGWSTKIHPGTKKDQGCCCTCRQIKKLVPNGKRWIQEYVDDRW